MLDEQQPSPEQQAQQKAFIEKTLHDVSLAIFTRWAAAEGTEITDDKAAHMGLKFRDAAIAGCNAIFGWNVRIEPRPKPKRIQAFNPDEEEG
jgi:hypothetical protein